MKRAILAALLAVSACADSHADETTGVMLSISGRGDTQARVVELRVRVRSGSSNEKMSAWPVRSDDSAQVNDWPAEVLLRASDYQRQWAADVWGLGSDGEEIAFGQATGGFSQYKIGRQSVELEPCDSCNEAPDSAAALDASSDGAASDANAGDASRLDPDAMPGHAGDASAGMLIDAATSDAGAVEAGHDAMTLHPDASESEAGAVHDAGDSINQCWPGLHSGTLTGSVWLDDIDPSQEILLTGGVSIILQEPPGNSHESALTGRILAADGAGRIFESAIAGTFDCSAGQGSVSLQSGRYDSIATDGPVSFGGELMIVGGALGWTTGSWSVAYTSSERIRGGGLISMQFSMSTCSLSLCQIDCMGSYQCCSASAACNCSQKSPNCPALE